MHTNFLVVLAAACIPMVFGAVWFSPRTLGPWVGNTDTDGKGHGPMTYVVSFAFCVLMAFGMTVLSTHDANVAGALYYVTHGTMQPEAGSDAAKWLQYYMDNLSAGTHCFKHGAVHGILLGGLFVMLPVVANNALYSGRGWKYIVANASYWLVCLALMGGVVAAWA